MKQILEFLNSHGSVRQFTDQDVSSEDEATIIATAERSPTSSNLHAWSVIRTRDKATKKRLAELTGGQQHVAECPLFLIFCADLHRLELLARERDYAFNGEYVESFIVATVDAALAGSRALMAAQALGMGGVMVGGIRNKPAEVSDLVKLPNLVYPVMGMSLGYPVKPPKVKPRLPVEGLAFSEAYDESKITAAIAQYDETIAKLGYLRGREVEPDKYPAFGGAYSWSEHTARRMASTSPGVQRGHLLEFLRERGFLKK
ncbi:hypothetical protein GF377_08820 [candidate division GN15 bacterium]|nr:hypothetical protein [candidate division GN15 bacterium]